MNISFNLVLVYFTFDVENILFCCYKYKYRYSLASFYSSYPQPYRLSPWIYFRVSFVLAVSLLCCHPSACWGPVLSGNNKMLKWVQHDTRGKRRRFRDIYTDWMPAFAGMTTVNVMIHHLQVHDSCSLPFLHPKPYPLDPCFLMTLVSYSSRLVSFSGNWYGQLNKDRKK